MTRALYAYVYDRLSSCDALAAILDAEGGVRRPDQPKPQINGLGAPIDTSFRKILTFGRLTRDPVPGYESRPIQFQTLEFAPWIRGESSTPADLVLEDIQDLVLRRFVWIPRGGHPEEQDCSAIIILNARHVGGDAAPAFNHAMEAWTKSFRLRFQVILPTCAPVVAWCGDCSEQNA